MCPDRSKRAPFKRQRGLGLVAAIFVITVMALLSVGVSRLVVTGAQSYGVQMLSTQALLAAESGAQLAVNRLLPPGGGGNDCSAVDLNRSFAIEGLQGCEANLVCQAVGPIQGITYYTLESEGRCGSGQDQAIRRLTLRIVQPDN